MARSQNSPRGRFSKKEIAVGGLNLTANSTGTKLSGGLALSGKSSMMTQNSTAHKLPGSIALGAQTNKYLNQDSTGNLVIPTATTLPTYRKLGGMCLVRNSTGIMLAYHSTGTTWKYANKTSVLA